MHFIKVKGILSSKNGMNLYRGCSHGCIYCDSRSKCYHIDHPFEDIEVKENAIEVKNSINEKAQDMKNTISEKKDEVKNTISEKIKGKND